jgi:hypothetical protein
LFLVFLLSFLFALLLTKEMAAPAQDKVVYKGGCFCGKCRFELHGKPAFSVLCHCSVCRRCHSADYAPLVGYAPSDVKITEGESNLQKWTTGREDRFSCKDCGSKVYSELNHLKHRAVFLHNIDGHGPDGTIQDVFRPTAHIFYGSGTISVYDGLPKFNTLPKAFGGDDAQLPEEVHDSRNAQIASCACGALKYRLSGAPAAVVYCHCKDCAKCNSAPFVNVAMFPVASAKVIKGKDLDNGFHFTERNTRHTCSKCSTRICEEPKGLGMLGFFASTLSKPEQCKPAFHIFYESATVHVKDGLPKFKSLPKEFQGSGETMAE